MPLSPVELYEQLKPHLGEGETKALIAYMDGKVTGEVATKEDLRLLKGDMLLLKSELKEDMLLLKAEFKEDVWKLRVLVILVLVLQVVLNPKVVELVGRILGAAK